MKRVIGLMVLLALVLSGVAAAQEKLIDNFESVHGFTTENKAIISYNFDPEFVKEGVFSLKVVKEAGDQRSMVRLRNYHRNFISDLTAYNRLGFWVYFPDVSVEGRCGSADVLLADQRLEDQLPVPSHRLSEWLELCQSRPYRSDQVLLP